MSGVKPPAKAVSKAIKPEVVELSKEAMTLSNTVISQIIASHATKLEEQYYLQKGGTILDFSPSVASELAGATVATKRLDYVALVRDPKAGSSSNQSGSLCALRLAELACATRFTLHIALNCFSHLFSARSLLVNVGQK
jgi:hypothetical protein